MKNMNTFKIHFLNTIWSDAIILERNHHFGFVDTGSLFYYPMIKEYLDKNKIEHLDFIILTHFHSDHYSNIPNIAKDYKVDKLYIKKYSGHEGITGAGYESNEEYLLHEKGKYEEILSLNDKVNEIIFLDDLPSPFKLDFLGVDLMLYNTTNHLMNLYNDETREYFLQNRFSENANSVPIFINYNNHTVFLGSDLIDSDSSIPEFNNLSRRILQEIYDKYHIDHIDIYKSNHHGGGGTNSLAYMNMLKPKYAVITNTDRWLDKWNTIDNLKQANKDVEIFKTDHYQYVFNLSYKEIRIKKIKKKSLFLKLKKN